METPVAKANLARRLTDAINLLGSVASITGISLLFLKDRIPGHEVLGTAVACAITASIGLGFGGLFIVGLREARSAVPSKWLFPFYCFTIPLCFFVTLLFVGMTWSLASGFFPFFFRGMFGHEGG